MISLRELKSRSAKHRLTPEYLVDRLLVRRVSIYVTWLLAHLPVTANQVTVASTVLMVAGAVCLAFRPAWAAPLGVALMMAGYVLDCCDGEIARFRGSTSLRGMYLDTLGHAMTIPAMFIAAGAGQAARLATPEALALGAVAAVAATGPARAALGVLKEMKGTHAAAGNGAAAGPAQPPRSPAKSLYLKTLGRLSLFPNSMFVLCAAVALDTLAGGFLGHRGAAYWTLAFYAALLSAEQLAAAAAWSREDRLRRETQ